MSPFFRDNRPGPGEETGTRLMPHLMFDGRAEEALRYYVGLFVDAKIESMERYGDDAGDNAGKVRAARARIGGQIVIFVDSPVSRDFGFTPAMSLFFECTDAAEIDRLYESLLSGGCELMPIDDYEFSKRFGSVCDKFGVSWQLNLAD